jgi:hypothetical protein
MPLTASAALLERESLGMQGEECLNMFHVMYYYHLICLYCFGFQAK